MSHFLGLEDEFNSKRSSKIAVLPVPFDLTSTWLKGADKGPAALIEASSHLELYDIETQSEVFRRGVYTAPPVTGNTTQEMAQRVESAVASLIQDDKFVVTLGGEHSISYAPIRAHRAKYGDFTVLQLDAHTDLRSIYEGDPLNHACVMARVQDLGLPIVSVGIRAIDVEELPRIEKIKCFFAEDLHQKQSWQEDVLKSLGTNVYITFDLDAFDPSIMSSTGTPEPGGLGWYETLKLLRLVFENRNVVGFDVVEMLPKENRAPEFLAAKLVYKMLSYKFELKQN